MITNLCVDLRFKLGVRPPSDNAGVTAGAGPGTGAADPAAAPQLQLAGSVTTGKLSFSGLPAAGAQ